MTEDESCNNCKFYRFRIENDGRADLKQRQCKRDTPKIFQVIDENGRMGFHLIRPGPPPADWCGEWKPRSVQ
jgi:hypothetical protein